MAPPTIAMMPASVPPSTTTGPTVSTAGTTPASTSARRLDSAAFGSPSAPPITSRTGRGPAIPSAAVIEATGVRARAWTIRARLPPGKVDLGRLFVAGSVGHAASWCTAAVRDFSPSAAEEFKQLEGTEGAAIEDVAGGLDPRLGSHVPASHALEIV